MFNILVRNKIPDIMHEKTEREVLKSIINQCVMI